MSLEAHTSAGIAIAAMSAVLTGAGTVVEKVALERLPEIHARHFWMMLRTLCASPQWLWGCACLLGGLVCQGLALVAGTDFGRSADLRVGDRPLARVVTFRSARSPSAGGDGPLSRPS